MNGQPARAFICGVGGAALSAAEIAFLERARPWGLILFSRNIETPEQTRALVETFRAVVGRPRAPVFIDQEGGRVRRLRPPHWKAWPAAGSLAALFARDPLLALEAARLVTWAMGEELARLGINVDCLPVLDVPQPGSHEIIGDRAYGHEPRQVALLARAALTGLNGAGVAGVIKHVPGHGRAAADSHEALPVVEASAEALAAVDFLPFAALADVPMAMTAHVVYTAFDAERPATLSPVVIGEVIRGRIGFSGLLMSDDLNMKALSGSLGARAAAALNAGCDVVLHCSGDLAEMEEVAAAVPLLEGAAAERARMVEAHLAALPRRSWDDARADELRRLLLETPATGV
jgi:beta-N-acetylhexosaminidase